MQAWQFSTGGSFAERAVPAPVVGPGQVLIDIRAAGLCHSDVGYIDGNTAIAYEPITLGHEVAGVVAAVGEGVGDWRRGDRVAVTCSLTGPGVGYDGGYAEQLVAPASDLVAIGAATSFDVAAMATDAGMTAHRAVRDRAEVGPGAKVGIIGLGGLGMLGAQIALSLGAQVYAADVKESTFELARGFGVTECATSITAFGDRELDIIIDFAGMNTTGDAFSTVRTGGRVVQVGIGNPAAQISLSDVLRKQIEYRGSLVGTRENLLAFLALTDSGEVRPIVEHTTFDGIGQGMDRLRSGGVTGRLVAVR